MPTKIRYFSINYHHNASFLAVSREKSHSSEDAAPMAGTITNALTTEI
jgi:hypothetical protein